MELWAAVDMNGKSSVYSSEPEWNEQIRDWKVGDVELYNNFFAKLACRGVKPGEKRKLKVFDPINEIVEYEDSLEERHRRLVAKCKEHIGTALCDYVEFEHFLRTEGYIN